jgi:hypothetical protein
MAPLSYKSSHVAAALLFVALCSAATLARPIIDESLIDSTSADDVPDSTRVTSGTVASSAVGSGTQELGMADTTVMKADATVMKADPTVMKADPTVMKTLGQVAPQNDPATIDSSNPSGVQIDAAFDATGR